jgi:CMP-N-acetylneuraminic acid synthetase
MITNKDSNKIKVLGIIPARGGSTGIPRKNIRLVAGKPLIYYTIQEAQKSKLLDAFIVSTDDQEIAEIAKSYGADVPFLRPKKFAQKYSAEIEYQQHALDWLEKNRGWKPDIVAIMKPTSPLRPASDIDKAIKLLQKGNYSMTRTVAKPQHHPYRVWQFKKGSAEMACLLPEMGTAKDFERWGDYIPRQRLPDVYFYNGAVDVTWSKNINRGSAAVFAGPIGGVIVDPSTSYDIDEPSDLDEIGKIISKRI